MNFRDDVARRQGFDNWRDLESHVNAADLSTPARREAFQSWKDRDGSKAGLLALAAPPVTAPLSDPTETLALIAEHRLRLTPCRLLVGPGGTMWVSPNRAHGDGHPGWQAIREAYGRDETADAFGPTIGDAVRACVERIKASA